MSKLDHPHILRCYGGNLEGANPFIVTELCECSLDKVRTDGPIWYAALHMVVYRSTVEY
jgi:hypothetical protein